VPNTVKRVLHVIREECKAMGIDQTVPTNQEEFKNIENLTSIKRTQSVYAAPTGM